MNKEVILLTGIRDHRKIVGIWKYSDLIFSDDTIKRHSVEAKWSCSCGAKGDIELPGSVSGYIPPLPDDSMKHHLEEIGYPIEKDGIIIENRLGETI